MQGVGGLSRWAVGSFRDCCLLLVWRCRSLRIKNRQKFLQSFVRRLVENPGSLTVHDIGIVCGLTQSSPEDLLELSLCWSEVDMALEMEELAAAHKE